MKQPQTVTPQRLKLAAKCVIGLSFANLVGLSLVNYLIYFVSETWWVGTVVTYAPRVLFIVPTLLLLVASLIWHWPSVWTNLVCAGIVLVPVMELGIPLDLWLNGSPITEGETVLKMVSCNVQSFEPNFDKVLEEITLIRPDVVALQEAFGEDERADRFFRGWNVAVRGQYRVYSQLPVAVIAQCDVTQFGGRLAGMIVQINTSGGPIVMGNIHQMTARIGLEELDQQTLINGKGTKELAEYVEERNGDAKAIRVAVDSASQIGPLIVCGDFNTPTSSVLFRRYWGDLKSSFDSAGLGYGYTSPCQGKSLWPDNVPWARIDHILCSHEWTVRNCHVGKSNGSDHRLITATLVLKGPLAD